MPLLNVSNQSIEILRQLIAAWPKLKALLTGGGTIRGSGAARVTVSNGVTVVHVDPASTQTPQADKRELWLEIVDSDGSPAENKYTVNVYDAAIDGNLIFGPSDNKYAFNLSEYGDGPQAGHDTTTNYTMSGYTIVPEADAVCGDYTGMLNVPSYRRHKVIGYQHRDGTPGNGAASTSVDEGWYYVFDFRADPVVKLT